MRIWLIVLLVFMMGALWLPEPHEARGLAGYVPLHTTLEVFAIAVAAMVFGISWTTQKFRNDGRTMLTGVVFLGVGLLDLSHTLSFQGMPDFITPNGPGKSINFWFAARSLAALGMLWLAFWPQSWNPILNRVPRMGALAVTLGIVALANLVTLAWPEALPETFNAETGLTPFKRLYELALISAYMLAGLGFMLRLRHREAFGAAFLAATALTMAISEFFFTVYTDVADVYNLMGHVYKLLAYGVLYQALFVDSVQSPFIALQSAQARQRAILETLPDILFEVDREGTCHAVYTSQLGKLAVPPSNATGRNLNDMLPQDVAERSMAAIEEAHQNGISRGTRIELVVPEGPHVFELSVARAPQLLPGGTEGFLVLSRDVTSTVRQEERIRFEAEVNAALLDLQEQLSETDEATVLRLALDHARRLTGSKLAFMHSVSQDGAKMELVAWDADESFLGKGQQEIPAWCKDTTALWANALHQSEPVVYDAGSALFSEGSHGKPLESGTASPRTMLSVQALEAKRVCMILVLAERDTPYTEPMVHALRMLASEVCGLVKRKRQDDEIHLLSTSLEQSPFPIIITNAERCIQYVNPAFTKLSGYSASEVLGSNPNILQSGETPPQIYQGLWSRLNQDLTWEGEFTNRHKDGSIYIQRALLYPVHDNANRLTHYVAHMEDVTSRKLAEKRIQELSSFDPLTGLFNKRAFEEQLSGALEQVEKPEGKVALLWFNLDNFKAVNDSMGRAVGDEVLLKCSKRLRQAFPPPAILGRYSGDSFAAVVSGADQSALALLAQNALRNLQQSMVVNGSSLLLSASVGIATYPDDAVSPSLLTTAAESAMRRVKEEGRNGFRFFAPDMQAHSQRSLELAADLRLAAQRGELHMVYQPQCTLRNQSLAGAEALLRWNHPKWGPLSPAEFIPLAEQTGAIVEIGLWVIEQVVKQWRSWHDSGLDVNFVAINFSAIQFAQPDLLDQLDRIVKKHDVQPQRLEIELTEAVALRDPVGAGNKIQKLHKMGFRVSIDDFGTGYSSMSYLKRYSLDKLKIDQSFIRDLTINKSDLAIVTAIVNMAHALDISAIAEGVETQEQMELLRTAGCDEIQGYFFARPLAPEDFEAFARQLNSPVSGKSSTEAAADRVADTGSPTPPAH